MGGVEERPAAGQLDGLLREVRRQAARGTDPDLGRILGWLYRQTGSHVALVADGTGRVEAATEGFPLDALSALAPLLARLSSGQLAAAATDVGALRMRCEGLGTHEPRPVLVVAGSSEPAPEEAALIAHVGTALTLLRHAEDSERTWRDYQRKAGQLRFAVLQALLAGEPMLARRMTTGVVPPLLDAGRLRIHLLHCPPSERDRISRAQQDPSGYHGPDLMVHCPVFKEHLICLVADDDDDDEGEGEAEGDRSGERGRGQGEFLRRLVRDNPRYALGVSGAHPLNATADAYNQAAHALAAARTAPDRVASYHGRTPLDGVLARRPALDWARSLVRPLDSVPKTSVDVTRLALNMPRSAVAGLLGLSRNTVAAHLRRAGDALGRDLTDVRCRATVHLALALTGSGSDGSAEAEGGQPPPSLDDLLATERAGVWAGTVLRPLPARHRRTLQAWIDANADAQRAAHALGISRNTVRAHLRAAEAVLGLDLLTVGTGIHDAVHALHIRDIHAG
ncbi:helix-turn-helix domain-containing protein [Streptomyces niveus]|uniref:PucR family transcriptional regulator n=1 Tax=Streptomyces niveus TaxID=193462 RepID=UPI0036908DE0